MPRCGAPHPEDPERTCIDSEMVQHADHSDRQGTWPNVEVQERMRALHKHKPRTKAEGTRSLNLLAGAVSRDRLTNLSRERTDQTRAQTAPQTGIPLEAMLAWSKSRWQRYATEQFEQFLRARSETFTTAEDLWPLIVRPPEMRAMSVVVQMMLRRGYMEEVGAKRLRGVYTTLDGTEFAENKLVPVYRSLIFPGDLSSTPTPT